MRYNCPPMAIICLTNIHKSFGSDVVFDTLNLQFHANEKIGMVGVNGSGKSTILKLILAMIIPDAGDVMVQKGLRMGYLPQEASFDPNHTVMEEMHCGVEHIKTLQDKLHEVSEALEALSGSELNAKIITYEVTSIMQNIIHFKY